MKKKPPRDLLTKGAGDVHSGLQRSPVLFHGRLRNRGREKRKKGKDMLGPFCLIKTTLIKTARFLAVSPNHSH